QYVRQERFRRAIAMQNVVFAALFEIDHELYGNTRAAGPARVGRVAAVAIEIAGIAGFSHLRGLEADSLRTPPQHGLAQLRQILQTRGQRDEVIACELSHLAGEVHTAIGQQNLGLADAAGIKNDLAGRRIAGVVLVRNAEVEIAERHPDPLAAPAHMDSLALERHHLTEGRAGLWRQLFLKTGLEREVA